MWNLQNITNSRSATAKLMIKMFVVDRIIGLAATTKSIRKWDQLDLWTYYDFVYIMTYVTCPTPPRRFRWVRQLQLVWTKWRRFSRPCIRDRGRRHKSRYSNGTYGWSCCTLRQTCLRLWKRLSSLTWAKSVKMKTYNEWLAPWYSLNSWIQFPPPIIHRLPCIVVNINGFIRIE